MASTPTARAFMAHRAGQIHPAFDMSQSQYDPLQDQIISKDQSTAKVAASAYTSHFLRVMEMVLENSNQRASLQGFDIRKAHDWISVRKEAGLAAQKQYEDRAKGLKGLFPRVGRKIGEMQPAIEPIAQTLPTGDYTALVCGGIVLLFKAFDKVQKVRENVITTMGEYPQLLDNVERLLKLFPDDERLEHKAISLYIALLVAVEGMIAWFEEKSWKRYKALMQQGLYARSLEDKIKNMHTAGRELREQAEICDMTRTDDIYKALKAAADRVDRMANEIHDGFHSVENQIRTTGDQNLAAMRDLQKTVEAQHSTDRDDFLSVKNEIFSLLSQREAEWEARAEARAETRAQAAKSEAEAKAVAQREFFQHQLLLAKMQTEQQQTIIASQQVLQILGTSAQDCIDIAQQYSRYARVQGSQKDMSSFVLSDSKFREWFASGSSQKLLVIPPSTTAKTSAGSFTAAALFSAFSEIKTAATVAHFCSKEVTGNPTEALLSNLICQLLRSHHYDLQDWSTVTSQHDHYDHLFYRDVRYLCSFFKYLIKASPYGAVFCIVDDVRRLEDDARPEVLLTFFEMIEDLIATCNDQESGVAFKPIFFTPLNKGQLVAQTSPPEIIRVNESSSSLKNTSPTPKQMSSYLNLADARYTESPLPQQMYQPPPYVP